MCFYPEEIQQGWRPLPAFSIKHSGTRSIACICRELTTQSPAQVVLGQQDLIGLFPYLLQIFLHPPQGSRLKTCRSSAPCYLEQPFLANQFRDFPDLQGAPLVRPDYRRVYGLVHLIQQHRAVHLSAHTNRLQVRLVGQRRKRLTNSQHGCLPPINDILFDPTRMWCQHGITRTTATQDRATLIGDQHLYTGSSQVDPHQVRHRFTFKLSFSKFNS